MPPISLPGANINPVGGWRQRRRPRSGLWGSPNTPGVDLARMQKRRSPYVIMITIHDICIVSVLA
jgi:hypothetical protein